MRTLLGGVAALLLAAFAPAALHAQQGPFNPEDWPATIDPNRTVHYVSTDFAFAPPSGWWLENELQILSGGDQVTEAITIGGHNGIHVTGSNLNIADFTFEEWADDDTIDILVQVYGDAGVLGGDGSPRNFVFLTGTLPELNFPTGGSIPIECKNSRWNWFLFRIPNGFRASDGSHFVGSIPANAQGGFAFGGVNGGTIRFEGVPGLKVRVIAFGEVGAFGEPDQVNYCTPAEECPPEPETNLAWVDVNASTSDHMVVIDSGDQMVTYQDNVGPAGDLRRAVRPMGTFLNVGITDNYLGEPCNDPRAIKVCVEFFDDPALTGVIFGPEAYATDALGGVAFYSQANRQTLMGTGTWIRRSWVVADVNLFGVNTVPYTGGPRLAFEGGQVFLSKIEFGVLRTGDHPLAGQDPLPDCFADPLICTDAYGNYAELDFATATQNGLGPGSSGGDQEMIVEEAGPPGDRRQAIRPAFDDGNPAYTHQFVNLVITDEALGPTSQPPAQLAICVTYYDDPLLIGETFRPEVYYTERGGLLTMAWTPADIAVALEGTDQWRDAYFEIADMKFDGVNQDPQAAARFVFSDKIFMTRVRYAVIRPCGPNAGVNLLEDCKPAPPEPPEITAVARVDDRVALTFPTVAGLTYSVDSTSDLLPDGWGERQFALTADGPADQTSVAGTGDTVTVFVDRLTPETVAEFFHILAQ